MDRIDDIHRIVTRIEYQMDEIRSLKERVSKLEIWQSWIKGMWATVSAVCVFLGWDAFRK